MSVNCKGTSACKISSILEICCDYIVENLLKNRHFCAKDSGMYSLC